MNLVRKDYVERIISDLEMQFQIVSDPAVVAEF